MMSRSSCGPRCQKPALVHQRLSRRELANFRQELALGKAERGGDEQRVFLKIGFGRTARTAHEGPMSALQLALTEIAATEQPHLAIRDEMLPALAMRPGAETKLGDGAEQGQRLEIACAFIFEEKKASSIQCITRCRPSPAAPPWASSAAP